MKNVHVIDPVVESVKGIHESTEKDLEKEIVKGNATMMTDVREIGRGKEVKDLTEAEK